MNFILDEENYVHWLLENGTLGKSEKMSIRILVKYFKNLGYTETESVDAVIDFMSLNLSYFEESDWIVLVKRLAKLVYEQNQELVRVKSIEITKNEMKTILSVENQAYQRILYTLLVYKKVQNKIHKQSNQWFNGSLGEVFKMARVGGSKSTTTAQGRIIFELKEAGLIGLAKSVKSLNLKLEYLDLEYKEEDVLLTIDNFDDVIYDYYKHINQRVSRCKGCGKAILIKKSERRPRQYCTPCKKLANNQQSLNYYYKQKG